MLSIDTEKNVGGIETLKAFDTKRFRLRAVSNETEIYERYFHKSLAKKVSCVQLGTAVFTLVSQMIVMFVLLDRFEYYSTGSNFGCGIWSSMAIILSSVMTLWSVHKPSYGKLHGSMALHIISVIAQVIFVLVLFGSGIPQLRRSIRSIHHGDYSDFDSLYRNTNTYLESDVRNEQNETSRTYVDIYGIRKIKPTNEDIGFALRQLNMAFVLNAMMAFGGIIQILFSFFMSLKTGRAICCGRTHLEGKFLEMEAIERGDGEVVANFRIGDKEREIPSAPGIVTVRNGSVGPPPYDSGLGFFGSPSGDSTSK